MNQRLKQFLDMEGLSPARFAEELGIQRSGMSHLLAGRNKPSFEFIQKMMTAYPDLNYEWLILGKGRPYKSDRKMPETTGQGAIPTEIPMDDTTPELDLFSEDQDFETENPSAQPAENRIFAQSAGEGTAIRPKKIARIIVFFNDGTYEEK